MKRFAVWIPIFAAVALLFANGARVSASPNAGVTLSLGESVNVVASNCLLSIAKEKPAVVKIICSVDAAADTERTPEAKITLTAGKSAKIQANACDLQVTKRKPGKMTVVCNAQEHIVKVGNGGLNYGPSQITINVGETVKWTWSTSNHTVTSGTEGTANGDFCSPGDTNCGVANASSAGATYEHTFNSAGTFNYFCAVHGASMSGSVVVQE